MATSTRHPRRHRASLRRGDHPLGGLPPLPLHRPKPLPRNVWAILFRNGDVGLFAWGPGIPLPPSITSQQPISATRLGNTHHRTQVVRNLSIWATRHAPKLREVPHGLSSLYNRALSPRGVRVSGIPSEANPDPGPMIIATAVAGGAAAGDLVAAGEAGAAGAEAGAAGGAAGAEGAAAGGGAGAGAASLAKKVAAGVGAATVAGIFTNVSWWKGLGMILIGLILGILAIREFSP